MKSEFKEFIETMKREREEFIAQVSAIIERRGGFLELLSKDGNSAYCIHKNTYPDHDKFPWRVTNFDRRGPFGHWDAATIEDALSDLIGRVVVEDATGTLDKWSKTETWSHGLDVLVKIEKENRSRL